MNLTTINFICFNDIPDHKVSLKKSSHRNFTTTSPIDFQVVLQRKKKHFLVVADLRRLLLSLLQPLGKGDQY